MKPVARFAGICEGLAVTAAAIALAAAMTYPLAFTPGGTARLDSGDGKFSIWNVAWVARTLIVNPAGVFNANIFHPHRGTLAYSEANLGTGLLAVPAYWMTRDPYVAHNFVVVLLFVLSTLGAYYLARRLTGSRAAAAAAAVLFAYCPFIFARTAHIQLLATAGLPFAMLALHRLVDAPSAGRGVTLGLVLAAQALSCAYYGMFAGLMVGFAVLYYALVRRVWRLPRYWFAVGLAAGTAILLVVPFLLPYLRLHDAGAFGGRSLSVASMYSADWRSYLASPARSHAWLLPLIERWQEVLFPGFLTLGLAAAGVWTGFRRTSPPLPNPPVPGLTAAAPRRETIVLYVLVAILALWMSLGPDARLYTIFFHTIPGFDLLRAPGRIGIIVALALVVLAAAGIASLLANRRRSAWIAAALVVAAACELAAVPYPGRPVPPVKTAYRHLARLPDGPVAEFPFFFTRHMLLRHTEYMLQSTHHWKPLVNGYSDHFPGDFLESMLAISSFPSTESFRLLKERGVRYVVLHLHDYDRRSREKVLDQIDEYSPYLRLLWPEEHDLLFEIVGWPPWIDEDR